MSAALEKPSAITAEAAKGLEAHASILAELGLELARQRADLPLDATHGRSLLVAAAARLLLSAEAMPEAK